MHAVLAGHRPEPSKRLEARIARDLIAREPHRLAGALSIRVERRHLEWNQLGVEATLGSCTRRAQLRLQAERVGVLAREPYFPAILSAPSNWLVNS